MADFNQAFTVDGNGLYIENDETNAETAIINGSNDPSVVGQSAPLGSLYLRTNGQLFIKIGAGDTDWDYATTGATSGGLQDPSANGIVVRTSLNTTTARTIVSATCPRVVVTNGDGVAGNPELDVCEMKFGNLLAFAAAHG